MELSKKEKISIINNYMKEDENFLNSVFSKISVEKYVSDYFDLNFVDQKGYDSVSKTNKLVEQKHIGKPKLGKLKKSPTISNLNSKKKSWILVTFEENTIRTPQKNMCFLFPPGILNKMMTDSDIKASNGMGRYVFPTNFVFNNRKPCTRQKLLLKYLMTEEEAYKILIN